MWFGKKKGANAEFEQWRASTMTRIKDCLNFWMTHTVFWEENAAEAEEIEKNLQTACDTLAGISFRRDERVAGFQRTIDAELKRIEDKRGEAESYLIMQAASQKIVAAVKAWILL